MRQDEFVDTGVVFPVGRSDPYEGDVAELADDVLDVGGTFFDDWGGICG